MRVNRFSKYSPNILRAKYGLKSLAKLRRYQMLDMHLKREHYHCQGEEYSTSISLGFVTLHKLRQENYLLFFFDRYIYFILNQIVVQIYGRNKSDCKS